jgi:nucleoside-diphosphate-sugar epimerase
MAPATKDFGYVPRVTIAEGLERLARWHAGQEADG